MVAKLWTEEETNYLIANVKFDWYGNVKNYSSLVSDMGRTEPALKRQIVILRSIGDLPPMKTDEDFLEVIKQKALFAETNQILNLEELCQEIKVSERVFKRRISKWRKDGSLPKIDMTLQFDLYRRHYSELEDKKIIYMKKRGSSNKEIANLLGRSKKSIDSRIFLLKELGELDISGHWLDWEEQAILENVTFDDNGFVNNYPKLQNLLQGRRNTETIRGKIFSLRKQGRLKTMPKPGTTSVKRKEYMQKVNAITFAKKEQKKNQIIYTHQTKKPTSGATEAGK
ncbi:hypothetical protein [Enterococcus gilvus]|uniref:Uncharacterized protein n=1 Tax=Enterococcus gilvus ATCC BAA-350 TaxID=1158614 RepID=R2XRY6_9ENTE|nr:hypothetical protein [Enterococcus gilvus]EOI57293.1 hypothetical protein UKC_01507 [Enterococcus gilvus ATCC BAA-350]EOW83133.1 hypothetical protein I592_02460 [Enterococcus gilvus ATCC BAA-350]OJG39350.1 hypothetical protein RV02_GL002838 [Enterococcus gilvus]